MAKGDLDLKNPKGGNADPKINPDPILGRFDLILLVLERIADAAEDLVDILDAKEEEGDGTRPDDEGGASQ